MIKWFAQEHPASCVAACVHMVLTCFGQLIEESEIRKLLGNPRFGLTLTQATRKLFKNKVLVELNDNWNTDDLRDCLRQGNYTIVGIERRFFGYPSATHAIVLLEIEANKVEFFDPLANDKPQNTNRENFENAWFSAGKEVLIIKSKIPERLH